MHAANKHVRSYTHTNMYYFIIVLISIIISSKTTFAIALFSLLVHLIHTSQVRAYLLFYITKRIVFAQINSQTNEYYTLKCFYNHQLQTLPLTSLPKIIHIHILFLENLIPIFYSIQSKPMETQANKQGYFIHIAYL